MSRELDLINSMLATTGATALSAGDIRHPNYIGAKGVLDRVTDELFSHELWFNTEVMNLAPDANTQKIRVPSGALAVDAVDERCNVVVRGEYLYDVANRTFKFENEVPCKVTLDFENLADVPLAAINYLRAEARYEFYLDGEGEQVKLARYAAKKNDMMVAFTAEQFKHYDANRLDQSRLYLRSSGRQIGFANRPTNNNWV